MLLIILTFSYLLSLGAGITIPSKTSGTDITATGPGTTLQSGYYWVRAVASPNFHKYMQTKPVYTSGTAVLGDYTTAGQFQIESGQLVQLTSASGEAKQVLYATVAGQTTNNDGRTLAVAFGTAKNTYGTFAWSGDALTWTASNVTRQNLAAWLVCANQAMFINLGAYAYQTPTGCADQTIHYYNDAHANN